MPDNEFLKWNVVEDGNGNDTEKNIQNVSRGRRCETGKRQTRTLPIPPHLSIA